ncbi:PBECR4 domain-containing protein [Paenibacillus sp. GCM10027626]|uniref:PBECR4 domain-containing protein n=1 Tax=Paenibacillus sp. GCM10027626 TaxID=3273411 RepID=UPI0036311750
MPLPDYYHESTLSVSRSFLILGEKILSLSITDLLTINYIPSPEEVSLQTIAFFYEEHLMNHQFRFLIKHKAQEIRVRFEDGALCHLLGIHHFVSGQAGKSHQGHISLIDGTITFESLKKMNSGQFEKDKQRLLAFPLVYQIVKKPLFLELDPRIDEVRANWQVYNRFEKVFVQLKLRRQDPKRPKFYVPVSLLVREHLPAKKRIDVKEVEVLSLNEGWS